MIAGAAHGVNLCAVLVDLKRGHGLDLGGFSSLSIRIDVKLLHDELGVVGSVTLEDGSDSFARRAPGSGEVDYKRLATVGSSSDGGVIVSLRREIHVSHLDVEDFLLKKKLIINLEASRPFIADLVLTIR